ncbi:MAG: lambda exonuclease family protein, partial [Pseudomonas fluorescens]
MIIVNCTQGSPEWLQGRAGLITASMFSTARAKVNGLNAQQRKYVDAMLSGKGETKAMELAGYKAGPKAEVVQRA